MQRHSATYCAVGVVSHHVPVHLLVDKAENDCLVTYECLGSWLSQ